MSSDAVVTLTEKPITAEEHAMLAVVQAVSDDDRIDYQRLRDALAKGIEEYAALKVADEREACARVADSRYTDGRDEVVGHVIAAAIRARGR